ncbi:glutamine synthetase family protein [Streptomyces sp. TLI_146]|uniref:glutamine synthetase family protein n=1 Tax=Streptomyces sp. TLI_146 TaxID=1938858 RepID=UPI000C711D06|nr:glutamine synthetase family protein [Streptomyces sp. TLI_146]PKV82691.1 glutamate--putrescine ligase [Streptomyces sp. TLI_146]
MPDLSRSRERAEHPGGPTLPFPRASMAVPPRPHAHAAPLEVLKKAVKNGSVDTVLCAVVDPHGRLAGKRFDARHFLRQVVPHGAEMCAYLLSSAIDMNPAPAGSGLASMEGGFPDFHVIPDLSTLRITPWLPKAAIVLADAMSERGEPAALNPREILGNQLARLAARGLHAKAGLETEFVLYQGTFASPRTVGGPELAPLTAAGGDYGLHQPPIVARYLRRLEHALAGAGMPVEAVKGEAAAGQFEVTLPYQDALRACDQHVVFKQAAQTLARQAGAEATFMAAPQTGVGSGLHLHVSLHRAGTPVFTHGDGGVLSPTGERAIAGLLDMLRELALLYAPNTNSYKRYVPGSFAPTRMVWGVDNRTCAVRVVGHGPSLRAEVRVPGADANPYLALAAVIAAIVHGLEHNLVPPPRWRGNTHTARDEPALPASLEEAIPLLEHSAGAEKAFGEEVVSGLLHLAQAELDHQQSTVTDVEQARWFTHA